MIRHLLLSALLLSAVGCVRPRLASPQVDHIPDDSFQNPFQARFEAPHGGYLFPFYEMVLEVQFGRNGAAQVFFYDEEGNSLYLDDHFRRAQLVVTTPGFSGRFAIALTRDGYTSRFAGGYPIQELLELERSDALRFQFVLPDIRKNYTRSQCHGGHWARALPSERLGEEFSQDGYLASTE